MTSTPTFEFDDGFQTKIAAMAVRDTAFNQRTEGLLLPEYFGNASEACLVAQAIGYYEKYGKAADGTTFVKVLQDARAKKVIRDDLWDEVKNALRRIFKTDISDRDYVVDQVAEFARHQAVENALVQSVELMERRDFTKIESIMGQALDVGANQAINGYDFWAKIEDRTTIRKDRAAGKIKTRGISTGVKTLDDCLFQQGWGIGELSVIMGGAKAGKCVTRDTLLLTEDGLVEIGDYVSRDLTPDSFKPHAMNVLGVNGMEPTSHVYNSGRTPTLRVTTTAGYQIEGTNHHPMLVMDAQGRHTWRKLEDLRVGDFMVVQRGQRVFGRHVNLSHAVTAGETRHVESKRADAMQPVTLPEQMTPELGEWLGMVIAEGYFGDRGVVSFTQKDARIMDRFCALTTLLFGLTPTISHSAGRSATSARVQSVVLQSYLEALGVGWTRSAGKSIPLAVRRAPQTCMRAFLGALLGLEGCVRRVSENKTSFEITMASEELMRQLHAALTNFGVVSKLRFKPSCATNGSGIVRPYWRLQVSGWRNIAILRDEIGLIEPRKQMALVTNERDTTAREWLPNCRHLVGAVLSDMQESGAALKSTLSPTHARMARAIKTGDTVGVRELTYAFATALLDYAEAAGIDTPNVAQLRDLNDANHFYDRVVEIEAGEAETVDLTVPGTHSFWANGLVSHNTTALIEFAKRASLNGENVLYVSLEVGSDIIAERCDASIADLAFKNLGTSPYEVEEKVAEARKRAGKFILHQFPAGTFAPRDLRRLIEYYKARGTKFSTVVVDYADIMAPDRYYRDDAIQESKSIYTGLRAIAITEDVAMLTATQTNRDGFKAAVAKAEHAAEDFNKVRIADLIISINASEEERSMGECRLYFAASRNQEGGFSLRIKQDLEKMRFITKVIGRES